MVQIRRKSTMMMPDLKISDTRWLRTTRTTRTTIQALVILSSLSLVLCSHSAKFSAPLNSSDPDEGFKPIIPTQFDPEYIARKLFTETGQYRIFSPDDSDLRNNRLWLRDVTERITQSTTTTIPPATTKVLKTMRSEEMRDTTNAVKADTIVYAEGSGSDEKNVKPDYLDTALRTELKGLEDLLIDYLGELFSRKKIQKPGISVEIDERDAEDSKEPEQNEARLKRSLRRFARSAVVKVSLPRTLESGRLLFFSSLKKILWPIFIGIQVIKSILFALFLPSIIGSLGKIATQGSASVAGFNRPSETVSDLNFNNDFADDSKFMTMNGGYDYHQSEASTNHFSTQLFNAAAANKNNALSRYGITDQRDSLMNALGQNAYKNTNKHQDEPLNDGYKVFKKLPVSSLLLSNYDPFYSPLLSRLDAIFQQLGLKTNDENCREKLICSMYANPAMYAPYSNLVSAQLSRDIDELRKPTSDNAEILRFFKYMKAAKDGQDGIKCEETFSTCTDFTDFKNPAMLTAYHDINKLVEARKML